jgi:hypothetical protein
MLACPVCDAVHPVGARFCNACGARVTTPEAPAPEPAAERGAHEAALDLRRRAATIVEEIAAALDHDLRARFLSQDDVRAILEP